MARASAPLDGSGLADAVEKGRAWHALRVQEAATLLQTSTHGLTVKEAAARLERYGPNRLEEEPPPSVVAIFVRQFANPLIFILVLAACVTLALGELLNTALIALALLLNAVIGTFQEHRSSRAVHALMQLVVPRSRVVRDGQEWEVESIELVPGDLVLLEPGSRVPADLRLTAVNALALDESLLTGESVPVAKQVAPVAEEALTADRVSMAFTGSMVTSGRGRGYVVATGQSTELGMIAGLVRTEKATDAPLHARMQRFARVIGISVLVAAIVAFASGVALGESAADMFHVAVAMAVSAVPEGLPVAVTVTLAIGVRRMARRHAVLRRLAAAETLGSTTVIGSDKTGTLTENRMSVRHIWAGGTEFTVPDDLASPGDPLRLTLHAGVLTNEAQIFHTAEGFVSSGDPTEIALLEAALAADIDPGELRAAHDVIAEIPYEPHRGWSATVRSYEGGAAMFVKGAPEHVIEMCTSMLADDGPRPLDADAAHEAARTLAGHGLRVLAMAYRPDVSAVEVAGLPDHEADATPGELVLVGLEGMMDPPRAGVREAVAACTDAGVRVIMITGDHAATAAAIAAQLGIVETSDAPIVTGADLARLDDQGLRDVVDDVAVFARAAPNDKLRIVRALQSQGHVVAVTGDGVNDAPALRAAATGVAMGRGGTDVAREASDMVLSDDNFVSIVAAIEEGRVAFSNIRKVAYFLIATAAAETAAILATVWLGWPLLLNPAQILWLNLVTNGVQDLALAFEPGNPAVLKRPPRSRREGILSRVMWERTVLTGVVMAAGALVMFRWQLDREATLATAQATALTTLVVFNAFQAGNARTEHRSLFSLSPLSNRFLFTATVFALGIHVAALHLPLTQYILGVEPIGMDAWARAIVLASTIVVVAEAHKAIRRRWPAPPLSR